MNILAIETSCDDTCAAVVKASGRKRPGFDILSNIVSSQIDEHKKFGGVVPELAARAKRGELIPLGWKGGIKPTINNEGNEIAPQYKYKLGSYNYLAEYLGLRGEDLNIDTDYSNNLKCSRFGIIVEFTDDISRLSSEVQVGAKSLIQE